MGWIRIRCPYRLQRQVETSASVIQTETLVRQEAGEIQPSDGPAVSQSKLGIERCFGYARSALHDCAFDNGLGVLIDDGCGRVSRGALRAHRAGRTCRRSLV